MRIWVSATARGRDGVALLLRTEALTEEIYRARTASMVIEKTTEIPEVRGQLPRSGFVRLFWVIPLVLTAILAAYFLYQAKFDDQFQFYPYNWHASWVRSPFPDSEVTCFRRSVDVDGPVKSAYMIVSADNFYTLYVNGRNVKPYFGTASQATYVVPITYNAMGAFRHSSEANVYNIAPLLRLGRNAIAIIGETDDKNSTPSIAVEGDVRTAGDQTILSDSSWRCARHEEVNDGVSWMDPTFVDTAWTPAVETNRPVTAVVDGDPRVLSEPVSTGAFIGLPGAGLSSEVHLRSTVSNPGNDGSGWMRIHTNVPYDLSINGRLIASTEMFEAYPPTPVLFRLKLDEETLYRTDPLARVPAFPTAENELFRDDIMLKHVLRPGSNTIDITLHGHDQPNRRMLPMCHLDGLIDCDNGSEIRVRTDTGWLARTPSTDRWVHAAAVSWPDFVDAHAPQMNIHPIMVDAGIRRYIDLTWYSLGFAAAFLILGLTPGFLTKGRGRRFDAGRIGTVWIAPLTVLAGSAIVQSAFAFSDEFIFLSSRSFAIATLATAACAWVASFAVLVLWGFDGSHDRRVRHAVGGSAVHAFVDRYGYALGIVAIMAWSFVLCVRITFSAPFNPDEYVSLEAARGILRFGIPVYEHGGFIYSRSSLFHYLLAATLWAANRLGSLDYTRFLAVGWFEAALPVTYLLGRELKSKSVGLASAALVALSPDMLFYACESRFYTQLTFFTCLALYFLLKCFRDPGNDKFRVASILAICGAYLSQQETLLTVEAFAVMILIAGQFLRWFTRKTFPWLVLLAVIVAVDLVLYLKFCLNTLPYVDNMAKPLLGIHLDYLDLSYDEWLGNVERSQIVIGIFYVIGLIGAIAHVIRGRRAGSERRAENEGWTWWKFLYLFTGIAMMLYAVHIPGIRTRYLCQIVPATTLASVCAIADLSAGVRVWMLQAWRSRKVALAGNAFVLFACLFLMAVDAHPVRTYYSTVRRITIDSDTASDFIAAHRRPGDKIAYVSPEVGLMRLGNCDFDWRPNEASLDKYFSLDGQIRERDSGGVVIDDVDKLRSAMASSPRIWLVIAPRSSFGNTMGASPALEDYVNRNFQIADETLGVTVYLWDRKFNSFQETQPDHLRDQFYFSNDPAFGP